MKIKKTEFIDGILSLVISQILIKIFGVAYSLYITNKSGFGDEGNAIYMSGYQIYALLLTISSIGVPNAISKIISEKNMAKDYLNEKRVFQISVLLFSAIGFIGCIFLFTFSTIIANKILEIPESALSLKALSPAIFFVSITSVIRGYCNGESKIYLTAKSQFFEQVLKSFLTIIFVEIVSRLTDNNTEAMAGVANLATTFATFFSLMYIIRKYYKIKNKKLDLNEIYYPRERISNIIKKILKISIPMTISAILNSLGKNIDSITVVKILKKIIGEENAIKKYGILSSKVDIIMTLPLSFNIAIATAIIPEISKRKVINDIEGIVEKIKFSVLITVIIAVPATFGIFLYSKQIFNLLFPNANNGYELLSLASIYLVFSLLTQTINGVLQGLGENSIPVYSAMAGVIVKTISNIVFIPISGIYEKGAVLGNIFSSITSFIIVYIALTRKIELRLKLINYFIKPIIASIIMSIVSLNVYKFLILKNINYNICTINSIVIAIIIYVLCVFVMKMINKNQIQQTLENTEKY